MKNEFRPLRRKVFTSMLRSVLLALLFSLILFAFINIVIKTFFVDSLISLLTSMGLGYYDATNIYWKVFINNKTLWGLIAFNIIFFITLYHSINRLFRYFEEISHGVDQLTKEQFEPIILSSEMSFMELKLNTIMNTIEKRTRDAKEAEQRKNDLIVYLAHDIKTPLTSIIGYLSLLDEASDMPIEQRAKYVNITLDKAYRLEQLINEFFEITRFNLQTIVLNKETVNLTHMLQQVADEFYPILEPEGKTLNLQVPDGILVEADADKLARVFNNVLKNAAAYSYSNTAISVTVQQIQTGVLIYFANKGKKIPENQINTIFEKFFRLDSARGSNTGGAGLGLAIAKEIVTAHQGTITASSDDNFTKFVVFLPKKS